MIKLVFCVKKKPDLSLAESAFQNGDAARAVALEQDALARVRGDDSFYREQLERFRQAAQP